jgi:type VI protein secretion system component VasK
MSKKKAKATESSEPTAVAVSVAHHPRAKGSIRRTRARTALFAFVVVLFLSYQGGVPGQEAVLRALIAGLVGNLIGWACALALWRQIVVQEVRGLEEQRRERARARAEERAAAETAEAAAATA